MLTLLATAFVATFLAELPDKTLYTVLLLATRFPGRPVLLGAWTAFAVQNVLAVLLGSLLARLPGQLPLWLSGAAFLTVGAVMILRSRREEPAEQATAHRPGRAFLTAFTLVFLAEFGDATQATTALFVLRNPEQRWPLFCATTAALWACAALALVAGRALGPRLPKRRLKQLAGVIFCVLGSLTLVVAAVKPREPRSPAPASAPADRAP